MAIPTKSLSGGRILVLGATGTVGRAVVAALDARGHAPVAVVRPGAAAAGFPDGVEVRMAEATDAASLGRDGFCGERFNAVVSCLASRAGAPADAWAVERDANSHALAAAAEGGAGRFLLVSAICVQKPRLVFQHAKLAFERELMSSGVSWTIVRPTAYFKSLSGQVARVRSGRPYLIFGDGRLTACKPISDGDLATFIADRLEDSAAAGRVLPIGGPGPAITPREMGERLFALTHRTPRFRSVPVAMLDAIAGGLSLAGRVSARAADKAEFARIGRYYATESMLVLDPANGRYDAAATPETGSETLFEHYARLLRGELADQRGEHAVF